jgi:predicted dienelactone hydrolase
MSTRILAVLATLLIVTPARADDACLEGGSYLTDRRAIDGVRADIEATCPCASYTGTPGNDRKEYQKCAKDVLKAALAAAELRSKCKGYTNQINKGAVCGADDRVTCGVFKEGARKPITCKAKKPTACVDKGGADASACADETHCRDVIDWAAGTCFDTRENGPFVAGARTLTFTKQSEVNPEETRTLNTIIWYPAPPGSTPISGQYAAVVDAPLDASGGPYPLVMFSHGSCGYPLQSTFLTAFLATHGFVVVAPPHPGNTINEFPTCGTLAAQAPSAVERPKDIRFVIDEMLALDQDAGSPFFGAIDEDRIAMTGHSFGGLTTFLVTEEDTRIKVAVPMAPATPPNVSFTIPSLLVLGQIDSVVNNDTARGAYEASASPRYKVEIKHAGHYAFSNACPGGPNCNPPTTLTQSESHALVRRWVLPFLKAHLAGDTSLTPLLASPPPPSVDLALAP